VLPETATAWASALLALAVAAAAVAAAAHAVLTKRDVRAAIGWVGLVLAFPLVGPVLYTLFGINRIRRRAVALRHGRPREAAAAASEGEGVGRDGRLAALADLVGRVTGEPLLAGNSLQTLVDGEETYPAMLAAIDGAGASVTLCTYIFDNDATGKAFQAALARAVRRGVAVRVLIDGVGARYSFPPTRRALRAAGVPVAIFLPTLLPWRMPYVNLRTHRKMLVADGRTAFVGGLNIRQEHVVGAGTAHPIRDLHFRLEGPAVAQVQRLFSADWELATGERLEGRTWFPPLAAAGALWARVVPDGPDEDLDQLRWTLLGALSAAERSVRIVTPYFLPDTDLVTALALAALRGVEVDILLPERNNLLLVGWAMNAQLPQVLEPGCRVWLTPPPFDHAKLLVVDGRWSLVGSFNWDPRSLRLNFELGLEVHGGETAARLEALAAERRSAARRLTLDELRRRPLPARLRDGAAWLAQPYL
jgi:cardiolipin synthase